jgi:hypothetical protein
MVDRLDFDEIMKIQNLMASRIAREDEVDLKIKIIDIINQLLGKKKNIQIEDILIETNYQGIEDESVLRIIDELQRDRIIIIDDGRIRINY